MIVDDERDVLDIIGSAMKKWNLESEEFTQPTKALECFRDNPSAYSLVLTDIRMPDMNGLELARRIRTIKPDISVILMTAFDLKSVEQELNAPTIEYGQVITKPFVLEYLHKRINRILEQKTGSSQCAAPVKL
jgi:DNA-binding NtrC family response regulator